LRKDLMPELRQNPFTGNWVVMALQRSHRPGASISGNEEGEGQCPFCPGNESMTTPEIWAMGRESGSPNSPGWRLRLIPNLYPALSPRVAEGERVHGTRHAYAGKGHHEILVQTPDHDRYLKDMSVTEVRLILNAFKRRYHELAGEPYVHEIVIIANVGKKAGASLEHPHSQIFTLPFVSPLMLEELAIFERRGGECLICAASAEAAEDGRMVAEAGSCCAFTPYASSFPYETWFVSRRHEPSFGHASHETIDHLSELIPPVLRALADIHGDPPYNLYIRSSPCDGVDYPLYHWRMGLIPRLTTLGGFELSTNVVINVVSSAQAADELRSSYNEQAAG
jgi:UDPglucose--hexose-1-phosphate uridylyltransferase